MARFFRWSEHQCAKSHPLDQCKDEQCLITRPPSAAGVASRVVVLICHSHLGDIYELDHFGKLRAFCSSASLKTTSIQSHTGRRARRERAGVRVGREWCIGGAGRLLTR